MKQEIKEKINNIRNRKIPKGYHKINGAIYSDEWIFIELSNYIKALKSGISVNSDGESVKNKVDKAVLKISCVNDGIFIPSENKKIQENELERAQETVKANNLLIVRKNTPDLVGNLCYVEKSYDNLYLPDLLWQTEFQENIKLNIKWLAHFLSSQPMKKIIKMTATGTSVSMKNITKDNFLELKVPQLSIEMQNKIERIISTWDTAIEKQEKLIELKKEQKKCLIQKLIFGKISKEWNKKKLKEILVKRDEKAEATEELLLYSLTIENGVTEKTDRYNREFLVKSNNKKYRITYKNDIVYNPANLRFGAIAINKIEKPVLLSPIYETLYIKNPENDDIVFLSQLLTSKRQIEIFSGKAEGTLKERMAVKVEDFLDTEIRLPDNKKTQERIGFILTTADQEINLLEKELNALKEQKKGLMQLLLTGIVRV